MNFSVPRELMAEVLSKTVNTVSDKDVQPILKNFLVKVGDEKIRVLATDMSLGAIAEIPAKGISASGTFSAKAKKLFEMVSTAPDGPLNFALEGQTLTISTNYKKVGEKESWKNQWKLHCDDPDLYPEFPEFDEKLVQKVDRERFVGAIDKVSFSIAANELKANLMAVYVNEGHVYASDSHRACKLEFKSELQDVMIPRAAVKLLVKLLKDSDIAQIDVVKTKFHLLFRIGKNVYHTRLLEEAFPDVEARAFKVSDSYSFELVAARKDLRDAIKRARITTEDDRRLVNITYGKDGTTGELLVTSVDDTEDSSSEFLSVKWNGEAFEKAINWEYLEDILNVLKQDVVTIRLGEESEKVRSMYRIEEVDADTKCRFISVIMPMRVAAKAGEKAAEQANKGRQMKDHKDKADKEKVSKTKTTEASAASA